MAHNQNNSNLVSDIAYIHQCVYELKHNELQTILEGVKQNKCGSKQALRKRVLTLLSGSSSKTKSLRQKIVNVYNARNNFVNVNPALLVQRAPQRSNDSHLYLQRYLRPRNPTFNLPYSVNSVQPFNVEQPQPPVIQFENLPFYNTMHTLLAPMHCQNNNDATNFTGIFYLTDNDRHAIVKSWNIPKQEYKIQIILRLVQVGRVENVTDRLPYNITVSVNDRPCKLPMLNIPTKAGITPWRCNVPIDITQKTELKNCLQNTLKITWSEETQEYMAGVYVAQKLTWDELLVELKKKPLRSSEKTKELIRKSMENDGDMGVDSMFATIKDPLSKTRMELPARGENCIHMQCFDAIQFLQMNEQKQTWICPLCRKKVSFEDIEVDEFFLNILRSRNLSENCENVILLQDGSWTEKNTSVSPKVSEINHSNPNKIEVFTLSDSSDDEDITPPLPKFAKYNTPTLEDSIIKSENVIDYKNSSDNDIVLDLSLKNNSSPSTSSENQTIITLPDDPDISSFRQISNVFNNLNLPLITISERNNEDFNPSGSEIPIINERQKKESRNIICITLD